MTMYSLTLGEIEQATGWGSQMVRGVMQGVPHKDGLQAGAGRALKLFRPADILIACRSKRRRLWNPDMERAILNKLLGRQDD